MPKAFLTKLLHSKIDHANIPGILGHIHDDRYALLNHTHAEYLLSTLLTTTSSGSSDSGKIPVLDGTGKLDISMFPQTFAPKGGVTFVFADKTDALPAGLEVAVYLSKTVNLKAAYMVSDTISDVTVDFWFESNPSLNGYPSAVNSICGGNNLSMSGQMYTKNDTLTGWTTLLTAGGLIVCKLENIVAAKYVNIQLAGDAL